MYIHIPGTYNTMHKKEEKHNHIHSSNKEKICHRQRKISMQVHLHLIQICLLTKCLI